MAEDVEAQAKLVGDMKAKYEADIVAIKSAKDKEISELRKSHEELSSKMKESDAVVAKLTGDEADKKKAESAETLRAKLIKEGVPETTLKFAETEREMNMLAQVWKDAKTVSQSTRLDTGGGLTTTSGKPTLRRDGKHYGDLQKWAETEQARIRSKYNI